MADSPLLELAGELRNHIWRFALVESDPIDVTYKTQPMEPGLLAVCKQVREEASDIYYAESVFEFKTEPIIKKHLDHGKMIKPYPWSTTNDTIIPYGVRSPAWFAIIGTARAGKITDVVIAREPAVGHRDDYWSRGAATPARRCRRVGRKACIAEVEGRQRRWRDMVRDYVTLFETCGLALGALNVVRIHGGSDRILLRSTAEDWNNFAEQIEWQKKIIKHAQESVPGSVDESFKLDVPRSPSEDGLSYVRESIDPSFDFM